MADIILKDESYRLVGVCMEVHRELGMGFKEVVYKDVLEVKSTSSITDGFVAQTINYLTASGIKLGIIANFGEKSFHSKRVVF